MDALGMGRFVVGKVGSEMRSQVLGHLVPSPVAAAIDYARPGVEAAQQWAANGFRPSTEIAANYVGSMSRVTAERGVSRLVKTGTTMATAEVFPPAIPIANAVTHQLVTPYVAKPAGSIAYRLGHGGTELAINATRAAAAATYDVVAKAGARLRGSTPN